VFKAASKKKKPMMQRFLDEPRKLSEARYCASEILSFSSDDQVAEFINRKRAQDSPTHVVHILNELSVGHSGDQELGVNALRRMGLERPG
jgi:hypothetical protein